MMGKKTEEERRRLAAIERKNRKDISDGFKCLNEALGGGQRTQQQILKDATDLIRQRTRALAEDTLQKQLGTEELFQMGYDFLEKEKQAGVITELDLWEWQPSEALLAWLTAKETQYQRKL